MPTPGFQSRSHPVAKALRFACLATLLALALVTFPRRTLAQTGRQACYADCNLRCSTFVGPDVLKQRSDCVSACNDRCRLANFDKPLPPAPYGAIAFGEKGAEGMAWNQTSAADADRTALNYCARNGTNCKLVFRFQNTCGALAKSDDGRHAEAATGPTKEQAAENAIAACRRWGTCSSDLSACSYADRHVPPPPSRAISWGAIAFSAVDGQAGWSQGKDDRASAEKEALSACSQRGKACAMVTAFNKQCGSLVRDGSTYGWAVAADQPTAMRQATQACTNNGGRRCVPQILFCSR